jgi:AAHS family 4-hydroxybenzoate transporter-like MFS transporter
LIAAPGSAPSLSHALDEGRWTWFQKRAGVLAILAVVLDGFDIQLIGVAIPALMEAWSLPREAFVAVLGLGLVAMSVGTAVSGWLGDRIGRKTTLITSMVLFGLGTLGSAMAGGMGLFLAGRLVASIGLGGAMPSAVALLSEFTPVRRRSFMVTFGMICTPVGGVMAGLVAAWLLPSQGWPALFVVGGVLPLVLAMVIAIALPESPQFLATKPGRRRQLERIAGRLGAEIRDDVAPPLTGAGSVAKEGYRALLSSGERATSLLLWFQFAGVLTAAFTVFNWLPVFSVSRGLDMAAAGTLLAAFNFGGMGGALVGALLIDRRGSRGLTVIFGAGGALACLLALAAFRAGAPMPVLVATLALAGLFIAGLQPMLFAIAANAYPVSRRSTGVGAALAIGRVGAIASSFIGAVLVGAGAGAFFAFLCTMMLIVTAALWFMPRHVPASGGSQPGV